MALRDPTELGLSSVTCTCSKDAFPKPRWLFQAAHLSGNPYTSYMNLAQVELRLQHPEAALQAYAAAEDSSPYRKGA